MMPLLKKWLPALGFPSCSGPWTAATGSACQTNYATLRNNRGTVYAPGTLRGIFLFHDSHKRTVDDLPRIIRDLRAGGCQRFVTVTDYLEGLMDPEPGLLMTRVKRGAPAWMSLPWLPGIRLRACTSQKNCRRTASLRFG